MRKISTFELIDGTYLKKFLWRIFYEEKGIDHFLLEAGIDSRFYMFTFGLPLYVFAFSLIAVTVLGIIYCIRSILNMIRMNRNFEDIDPEAENNGEI
jgi:hypothetical protein